MQKQILLMSASPKRGAHRLGEGNTALHTAKLLFFFFWKKGFFFPIRDLHKKNKLPLKKKHDLRQKRIKK